MASIFTSLMVKKQDGQNDDTNEDYDDSEDNENNKID